MRDSAMSFQKALPTWRKLRWSMIDKDKFENLITRLKEHKKNLNRILPVNPKSPPPRGLLFVISLEKLRGLYFIKGGSDLPRLPSR